MTPARLNLRGTPRMPRVAPKFRTFTVFDRSIFKKNWRKINEAPAKKAGLAIRRTAINSIRKAERAKKAETRTKPSRPGRPPKSRAKGHPMRRIFSLPTAMGTSVLVGPVGFGETHPAPEVHEKGLAVVREVKEEISDPEWERGKSGRFFKRRFRLVRRFVDYPERPFMRPALEKNLAKLPPLWRGSLN